MVPNTVVGIGERQLVGLDWPWWTHSASAGHSPAAASESGGFRRVLDETPWPLLSVRRGMEISCLRGDRLLLAGGPFPSCLADPYPVDLHERSAKACGAAVHEVDKVDDDTTLSGVGPHTARTLGNTAEAVKDDVNNALPGNKVPGIQTGGHDIDGTPDTRGITEKIADAVTGDNIDDKTGKPVR